MPVRDSLMPLPVNSSNPVIRFKQNRDVIWSQGFNFSIVTKKHVNNYGFLNDQDYKPDDTSRLVAVIGDSYVEAAQVHNKDAMHGILSRETSAKGRVYSFGASGSPLSNYLAYANYATQTFHAQTLVFIVVGNDFDESLTKYKNAPGFHYFTDVSDRLELARKDYQPTLMKRLSWRSALVRYIAFNLQISGQTMTGLFGNGAGNDQARYVGNTRADFNEERLSDSKRVVERFFEELPVQTGLVKQNILFVVDGMRPHLYNPGNLDKANGSYFDLMRKYFIASATDKGYEVIDMQPIFIREHESHGMRFEFPADGHWNEAGHSLVAKAIADSTVYKSAFNN